MRVWVFSVWFMFAGCDSNLGVAGDDPPADVALVEVTLDVGISVDNGVADATADGAMALPDAGPVDLDATAPLLDAAPDATAPLPDAAPDATPPAPDAAPDATPPLPDAAPQLASRVLLSEVMYHPAGEADYEDQHEFLELHNAGEGPADLDGWAFDQGIRYTFDAVTLEPGATLVLAANPARLAMVYALDDVQVLGPYEGRLANGGERVRLVDRAGLMVDAFKYDDAFPWPVGADALGASTLWLPADSLPVEDHALRGRSLQRRSFDAVTADPANWEASALDAADPGSVATVSTGEVPGTVVDVQFNNGAPGALTPDAPVSLQVRLTGAARAGLRVEWFADDVQVEGEPVAAIPLIDAGDGLWTAALPPQPDQTIVRARVVADSGVVSPRPHDPMAWHAAFVATPIPGVTRPYRLYINTDRWTALWDAVAGGRVLNGCVPNPGWALRVPAVFVHEGRVFDVRIRYQGSRWNRTRGRNIANWEALGPDRPGPLRSLSWSVRFPRYAPFDGRSAIILNKLTQGCPGLSAGVGFGLFDAVGLPTPQVRFTRLFINGQYFNYNLELERPGEEMLNRWLADTAADNPGAVPEPGVPHLFKASGCNCNEGPYGWGDGRPLEPHCEYSVDERYASTYERKTWAWAGHDALRALIESHDVARSGTDAELAAFLAEHFDVDLMLNYLAVINWAVPFDDMFHNHYWVQRRSDDRWFLAPWDLDQNFGGWKGPNASIYIGASGDRDNRAGWWHRVKDSFLRVYRAQYTARLAELNETTLHPDAVIARVDAIEAAWRLPEVEAAPAGRACDFTGQAENFRRFARARHDVVEASTAPP